MKSDAGFADTTAKELVAESGSSLQKTLSLISGAGIQILGSVGDDRVYVEARPPWNSGVRIRAGQAMALHELIATGSSYSLRDFLSMYKNLSHVQPDLRADLHGFSQGLLEELVAEDRNPVWSALVLGGTPQTSKLYRSLAELAKGAEIANIPEVELSPVQVVLIILRMRYEAVGMLSILGDGEGANASPQRFMYPDGAILRASQAGPCEFDSPLSDAGAKGLSKLAGQRFKAFVKSYGDNPMWKDPDGVIVTGNETSQMISAISFWSSMLNLVLAKALTQLDLKVVPNPLERTPNQRAGKTGLVEVHAYRSDLPAGKYAVCAERVLSVLGTSFKASKSGDLEGVLATFYMDPGQPVMLTEQDKAEWSRWTDDHGVAKTELLGRPQDRQVPDDFEQVTKEATVAVSVNPDTAEKWWETTFAAVVDAVKVAKAFRRLAPTPDPVVGLEGAANFGLRAANYFGWLNNSTTFQVKDWEQRKVLRYTVALKSEMNIPLEPCHSGYIEKVDFRLGGDISLSGQTEADGTTTLVGQGPLRWASSVHDKTHSWHSNVPPGTCKGKGAAAGGGVCTAPPSGIYISNSRISLATDGELSVKINNYGGKNESTTLNLRPNSNGYANSEVDVPAEIIVQDDNFACTPPSPNSHRRTDFLSWYAQVTTPDPTTASAHHLDRSRAIDSYYKSPYESTYRGLVGGSGTWIGTSDSIRVEEHLDILTDDQN